jgi:putative DNA primase/helicase
VTGLVAFGALARIVMVAARQQDSEEGKPGSRVLMRVKSNVGPDDGGFSYDLQLVPMREHLDIIASVVSWGEAVSGSARDVLADVEAGADENDKSSAIAEAKDWLTDFLMGGPRSAKECKAESAKDGHAWRTIRRAQNDLGIKPRKTGDGWVWAFAQDHNEPAPKNLGHLGHLDG